MRPERAELDVVKIAAAVPSACHFTQSSVHGNVGKLEAAQFGKSSFTKLTRRSQPLTSFFTNP